MNLAYKLGKLMTLGVTVNLMTEHAVFMDYAGHCSVISLRVCASKADYNNSIFSDDLHINVWPKKLDETLERWTEYLNGLLTEAAEE